MEALRVSFEWLCTRPHPVTIDGRDIAGLADQHIALDELRELLLDPMCPAPVRDAVWAHLIRRSRIDGPSWTVACAGMALPMLVGLCRLLTDRYASDRDDIDAEVLTGFLEALAAIDPERPRPLVSLRWSAYRAGLAAVQESLAAPRPVSPDALPETATGRTAAPERAPGAGSEGAVSSGSSLAVGALRSAPPPARAGHPDLVLARAVLDGVLTVAEAGLIGATRLEDLTVAEAAAARGRSVTALTVARHRAERRLLHYLTTPPDETGDADQNTSPAPPRAPHIRSSTLGPGPGSGDTVTEVPGGKPPTATRRHRHRPRRTRTVTTDGPLGGPSRHPTTRPTTGPVLTQATPSVTTGTRASASSDVAAEFPEPPVVIAEKIVRRPEQALR